MPQYICIKSTFKNKHYYNEGDYEEFENAEAAGPHFVVDTGEKCSPPNYGKPAYQPEEIIAKINSKYANLEDRIIAFRNKREEVLNRRESARRILDEKMLQHGSIITHDQIERFMDGYTEIINRLDREIHNLEQQIREGVQTQKEEELQKAQTASTEPIDDKRHKYVFRRQGNKGLWEIIFDGIVLPPFNHLDGFAYIRYLFQYPDETFYPPALYKAVKGTAEGKKVHSAGHLVSPGEEEIPILEHDDAEKMSFGYSIDQIKSIRSTIYQCINRAKEAIRDCGLEAGEELWIHLRNTISSKKGFVYNPVGDRKRENISWVLD